MNGYTKLFNSILFSTIWQEPNETRILWITMLAMSDQRGEVMASVPGLAKTAGISIESCRAGLNTLLEPDPDSRTQEREGRRIEVIPGGWWLINHEKYRALLSAEERREYNRRKQAEHRQRQRVSKDVNDTSITVNHNQQCQHIQRTEADTDSKAEREAEGRGEPDGSSAPGIPPVTLEMAIQAGPGMGVSVEASKMWWLDRDGVGWVDSRGQSVTNWRSNLTAYGRRWQANEAKGKNGSANGHQKPNHKFHVG